MLDIIRTRTQSWGVKIIFAIIIIVFVFWGVGNMTGMSAGTLASVDGEAIALAAFQRELQFRLNTGRSEAAEILGDPAKFDAFKRQALTDMIGRLLRNEEAKRLGIVVTPHELKRYRNSLAVFHDANGKFDEDRYQIMLKAQSLTTDQFLEMLEQDLRDEKLLGYVGLSTGITDSEARNSFTFSLTKRVADYVLFDLEEYKDRAELAENEPAEYYEKYKERYRLPVRAEVEYITLTPESLAGRYPVTEEEAQEFYNTYKDRFEVPESYQIRHIYIAAPADAAAAQNGEALIAEAQKRITEAEAKLKAGEDFAEVARQYSMDEASAAAGGMLPVLEKGTLGLDEIDAAALALEPGQVSGVVRSPAGFHLLKLVEKKPQTQKTFDETKDEITGLLALQKAGEEMAAVEKEAEDGLTIGTAFAELGKKFTVEPRKTELLPQTEVETLIQLEENSRAVFADSVIQAIDSAAAVTVPVPLSSPDGIVLVRIEKALNTEIPAFDAIKDQIVSAIKTEKAETLAQEAAKAALPSFTGKDVPEAFAAKVRQSAPVLRVFPEVSPLGLTPQLAEALFNAPIGVWLPEVYTTEKGPVIARVASQESFSEADWAQRKGIFESQYRQRLVNEAAKNYQTQLAAKAKIEIQQQQFDAVTPSR